MKKISVLLILILSLSSVYAKEYYFQFSINDKSEINEITRIISIDNVERKENLYIVTAYANDEEFSNLKKLNIEFTLLTPPGEAVPKSTPAKTLDEVREWDVYPTYQQFVDLMYQFQTDFPSICRIESIGTTPGGHEMLFAVISDNVDTEEAEPEIMLESTMHGDETVGYVVLYRFIDWVLNNYGGTDSDGTTATMFINDLELWIMPNMNPDGTYRSGDDNGGSYITGATRGNRNGIDINRNFPAFLAGDHPDGHDWQYETIAMMNLANSKNFVLSANFHGGALLVNYPYDSTYNLHPENDWFIYASLAYSEQNSPMYNSSAFTNGISNGADWYLIHGGRQDWFTYNKACKEVTVEMSNSKMPNASTLPSYWDDNKNSIIEYLKTSFQGIKGIVTDASSKSPLGAVITVNSIDGDIAVSSDPDFGDYYKLLLPGTYTITVSKEGYIPKIIDNITVTEDSYTVINAQLTMLKPEISVTPLSIDFGDVETGDYSSIQTFSISNSGNADLTVSTITAPTGFEIELDSKIIAKDKTFSGSISEFTIGQGSSETVNIRFHPTSVESYSGNIVILNNDSDEGTVNVSVQGEGLTPTEPEISVTPLSIDFGDVETGDYSSVQIFSISNSGNTDLTISSITAPTGFEIELDSKIIAKDKTFSGNISEFTIGQGSSETVNIRFHPTSVESYSGNIVILNNDSDEGTVNISVQGESITPTEPEISVTPLSIDFGDVETGDYSSIQTFSISNSGNTDLTVSSITVPIGFEIEVDGYKVFASYIGKFSIDPQSSKTVNVRFYPEAVISYSGNICVNSNDSDEPSVNIAVSGNGVQTSDPFGNVTIYPNNSMTIYSRVFIDSEICSSGDIAAVFAGTELRGKQEVILNNGQSYCTLNSNIAENDEILSFKIWDKSKDQIFTAPQTIYGVIGGNIGSNPDFFIINAGTDNITQEIQLHNGWNLISFSVHPEYMAPESIFSSVIDNIIQIKNSEQVFDPSLPEHLNTLSKIEDGKSYWVKTDSDITLTLNEPEIILSTVEISLSSGWNLIGFPKQGSEPVTEALAPIVDNILLLKDIKNVYNPALPDFLNTLLYMEESNGYLIELNESCTMSYNTESGDSTDESSFFELLPEDTQNQILWFADNEDNTFTKWEDAGTDDYYSGGGIFLTDESNVSYGITPNIMHSGKYGSYALIKNALIPGEKKAVRLMRWTDKAWNDNGDYFPDNAYYSVFIYFPYEYNPEKDPGNDPFNDGGWWNIFQFKSDNYAGSQPVVTLDVYNEGSGMCLGLVVKDYTDDYSDDHSFIYHTQTSPVILHPGEWIHIEAKYVKSNEYSGEITLWQNGTEVFSVTGIRTVLPPGETAVWGIGNYTDYIQGGNENGKAVVYFDDAAVSETPLHPYIQD